MSIYTKRHVLDFLNTQFLGFRQDDLSQTDGLEINLVSWTRRDSEVLEGRGKTEKELDARDA